MQRSEKLARLAGLALGFALIGGPAALAQGSGYVYQPYAQQDPYGQLDPYGQPDPYAAPDMSAAQDPFTATDAPALSIDEGEINVFFEFDRADITAAHLALINGIVDKYFNQGGGTVQIIGYADRIGEPSYNVGLSQRRADAVKRALIAQGVPANAIVTGGQGIDRSVASQAGLNDASVRRAVVSIY